jgi:hypothetical protein
MKPNGCCRQRNKHNTEHLGKLEGVFVVVFVAVFMIVAFRGRLSRTVRMELMLVEVRRVFVCSGHDLSWLFS